VLEKQGWTLHRIWTPHFYRDPKAAVKAIVGQSQSSTGPSPAAEPPPMAKPVGRL
jgi:hypothetical protein